MKIYLLLILAFNLFGCTSKSKSGNDKNNSTLQVKKINQDSKSIIKDSLGYVSIEYLDSTSYEMNDRDYPYLNNDTLFIFEDKNSMILKIIVELPDHGELKKYYKQLDSLYYVKQTKISNGLFISIGLKNTELDPSNFVIVDIQSKKVVLNITADCFDTYIGSSQNGQFHSIESGTAPTSRDVRIYNTKSDMIKQIGYYSCEDDTNQLHWTGNMFYYWDNCKPDSELPDSLPDLKQFERYIQKYYWVNGVDSVTNEFRVLYNPM